MRTGWSLGRRLMKYMGSKRWMLQNGLGHLLENKVVAAGRFVDLFSGSGVVASFVAQRIKVPVVAFDLQLFCVMLAKAIIGRVTRLDAGSLWAEWHGRALGFLEESNYLTLIDSTIPELSRFTQKYVVQVREACALENDLEITKSYGGHYFSQKQALWLDVLRNTLPKEDEKRTVALAALITAASQCVASPGHTAQPFQPTRSAKKFLYEAWNRDIVNKTKTALDELCGQHALSKGTAEVSDANEAVEEIDKNDVVFIDPPYSGVHYSRFYHVLETIARGECGDVSGVGRYPPSEERPWSRYSVQSESREAISELLKSIAEKQATAIVTFPNKLCSNGISSYLLRKLGEKHFNKVSEVLVRGKFSTLGGNGDHREARQTSAELVLVLEP